MKKEKSNKRKLLGAIASLLLSAAMLSTSTYAWFTMNKEVEVRNLMVQAKAEGGLLISETSGYTANDIWDNVANTVAEVKAAKVSLYPTSTANSTAWYHATSKTVNDAANATAGEASAQKSDGYNLLTLTSNEIQAAVSGSNGKKEVFFVDSGKTGYDENDAKYYVKYTYYLKTSTEGTTSLGLSNGDQNVNISVVGVTGNETSTDLNKSIRVGIEIGGKFYIFAPVSGATGSYYVNAAATATTAIDSSSSTHDTPMTVATALSSLPGIKQTGIPVYIYLWYEGEDANCKSENVTTTLDELTVKVEFKLVTLDADTEDVGIEI